MPPFVSSASNCFFCENKATTRNSDGLMVCERHRKEVFQAPCPYCGGTLEVMNGRYGEYFKCLNIKCDQNISIKKYKKILKG